jgi:hypothetical protein
MADNATLLRDHVTLTCRPVDRVFLQAYVPKLQCVGGVCQFLCWQKGFGIPSSAFGKIGDAYVAEVHRWPRRMWDPGEPVRQGREQGADRPSADRDGRTRRWRRESGADRRRAGEDPGVAVLERQGPRACRASAHGVGPADGVCQPLLLLPCGIRTGVARFGRPTPTPRGRCGFGSTGTAGRNASVNDRASAPHGGCLCSMFSPSTPERFGSAVCDERPFGRRRRCRWNCLCTNRSNQRKCLPHNASGAVGSATPLRLVAPDGHVAPFGGRGPRWPPPMGGTGWIEWNG